MPEDIATRHGLKSVAFAGAADASYKKVYRGNRQAKMLFEGVKRYRQFVHKVNEPRLATTLRLAVHYLFEPMTKGTSSWQGQSATVAEAGPAPQTILKV